MAEKNKQTAKHIQVLVGAREASKRKVFEVFRVPFTPTNILCIKIKLLYFTLRLH